MEAHEPVLLKDFIKLATPITGCWVDCTFGAGGYSRALLQNGASQVLAIDKDSETKVFFKSIQYEYGNLIKFYNQSFADMETNNDIINRDDIAIGINVKSISCHHSSPVTPNMTLQDGPGRDITKRIACQTQLS